MVYSKEHRRKALKKIGKLASFCMFLRAMTNKLWYFGPFENNMINWVKFTYFKRLKKKKTKKSPKNYGVFNINLFAILGATKGSLS